MTTDQPTTSVVHHHHRYGTDHAAVARPAAMLPAAHRPALARRGPSPAVLLAAGAGITIALVVAVTVATALSVVVGLAAVVVLLARSYVAVERDSRRSTPVRGLPSRDARGRFTT